MPRTCRRYSCQSLAGPEALAGRTSRCPPPGAESDSTKKQNQNGASPLELIEALRSVFPRNGIATCDVSSHKLMMGQFWRSYEPGTFFMSNGLSGMGYGIPAAIAAQLVYPDRAVISVVGDGGMLMMLHDLVLIRELNLPLVIVVLTDGSLSLIRVSSKASRLSILWGGFYAAGFCGDYAGIWPAQQESENCR